MSTEQREIAKQDREPAAFETRDLYFACCLRSLGYELLGLPAEGPRKGVIFRDRAPRREDVMAFYGDATSVRPLPFAATNKDMKGLPHNG